MKSYKITLSNGSTIDQKAASAADAIQSALIAYPGNTVTACALRDLSGNGMSFDIPSHRALTKEDVARLKPKRETQKHFVGISVAPQKNAPWIEEWMKGRK